nr:immunoglobulin heavy chain junction region [Mus musculus]
CTGLWLRHGYYFDYW